MVGRIDNWGPRVSPTAFSRSSLFSGDLFLSVFYPHELLQPTARRRFITNAKKNEKIWYMVGRNDNWGPKVHPTTFSRSSLSSGGLFLCVFYPRELLKPTARGVLSQMQKEQSTSVFSKFKWRHLPSTSFAVRC